MLDLVGELVAVGPEQLDAVVVERIVRCRDHHAEIGAHRTREHGDCRRRHRPELQHVHADRGEARDQRGLDHVAGQTGVLADDNPMAIVAGAAKHHARCLSNLERQFGRDHAIGTAANSVGSEILTRHHPHRQQDRRRSYPDLRVGRLKKCSVMLPFWVGNFLLCFLRNNAFDQWYRANVHAPFRASSRLCLKACARRGGYGAAA